MVEPLKDPAFSGRVYVSFGIPTWPNGFELDAIALDVAPKFYPVLSSFPVVVLPCWAGEAAGACAELLA